MNLGELASGLALITNIPQDARAILIGYSIEFTKKARGTLIAKSSCERILSSEPKECQVIAEIADWQGNQVARVSAKWKIGPKK